MRSLKQPDFKKSRLDNGAILVTESLPQFQSLSIGAWVSAGTRHELPGEEGISHFLEHMMFKGTEKRSALDIALAVDRVGGEFNAFTTREYTCFHLFLLGRDLGLATDIISDVLLNSKFAEEEVERERKVILQEISMVDDNPEEHVHDIFFDQAFGGHPLGKPILGTRKTVAKMKHDTVREYFSRHYDPAQMVIAVAGDVEHEKVKKLFNKALKNKRSHKTNSGGAERPNMHKPRFNPGINVISHKFEQAHLVVGFPGVQSDDQDRFSAYLVNIYLGGGMSSSLFQEVREKRGLAYTIYSALSPFSDSGLMSLYVGTAPEEAVTCFEVMGQELAKLRTKTLDKDTVAMLKENLKSTILLGADSVENRMMAIAKSEMIFGRYFSAKDITREIDKVSPQDLRRVARKLVDPKKMIITAMGPKLNPKKLHKALSAF